MSFLTFSGPPLAKLKLLVEVLIELEQVFNPKILIYMSKIRPSLPPQRHVKKESISCFIAYFPQFFPQVITPGSNISSTSYASLPNLHGEILYSTKYTFH